MTLGDHLEELRFCLIKSLIALVIGSCIGLYIGTDIVKFIQDPLPINTISLNVYESFSVYLKVSLITGGVIASPYILYQFWTFISSGLYKNEKRYVYIYFPISICLFLMGVLFSFYIIIPYILNFLLDFNTEMEIVLNPRITEWIKFVLTLPICFGISFQLPLVMKFLNYSRKFYLSKFKIAILIIFILSMILTPADPFSMIFIALPLIFLYMFGILICG